MPKVDIMKAGDARLVKPKSCSACLDFIWLLLYRVTMYLAALGYPIKKDIMMAGQQTWGM